MIYNPFLDQLYAARKGHGAFLSFPHSALPVLAPPCRLPLARPLPSLGQALVSIERDGREEERLIQAAHGQPRGECGRGEDGALVEELWERGAQPCDGRVGRAGLVLGDQVLVCLRAWGERRMAVAN